MSPEETERHRHACEVRLYADWAMKPGGEQRVVEHMELVQKHRGRERAVQLFKDVVAEARARARQPIADSPSR